MRSKRVDFLLLLVTLTLVFCGCSNNQTKALEQPSVPRNIYLITATGLRADHLSSYMYQPIQTPGLDYLAYDGVRFTRAFSTSTDSLPAHDAMLSGLYPMRAPVLQIYKYFQTFTNKVLPESKTALPFILRDKGYRTGAFVADPELRSFVLRSGWFDKAYAGDAVLPPWQPSASSDVIRTVATEWVSGMRGHPHFVFLNFYEPTPPYSPPEPYNHHYANHPYDGEVAAIDEQVGHFIHALKQAKLFEHSIVIFTAPYGENPDSLGRAGSLEDGNLKIPMIIAAPGLLPRQQMYETAVSLADLYPTILALLKLSALTDVDGSILFEKNTDTQIRHDFIYGGSLFPLYLGVHPRWFVWSDGWKLTSGAEDVSREEDFPLGTRPETIRKKEQELRALLAQLNGISLSEQTFPETTWIKLEDAIVLARMGNFGEALKRLEEPALPETPSILSIRSALLDAADRPEDSRKAIQKAIQMHNHPELLLQAVDLELRHGNIEHGAEVLNSYKGPMSYDIYSMLSIVLRLKGRLDAAHEKAELALMLNPRAVEAHRQLGLIFYSRGNFPRAEVALRKALELNPDRLEVKLELAETLMKLGKSEEAKRLGAVVVIQSASPELRQRAKAVLAE